MSETQTDQVASDQLTNEDLGLPPEVTESTTDATKIAAQAEADAKAEAAEIAALYPADPLAAADLDRTQSYGEVHGHPKNKYFQNGKYFDHRGKLIVEEEVVS